MSSSTPVMRSLGLVLLAQLLRAVAATTVPTDDSDLFKFVSRPDLRPSKFNITVSEPGQTPGYWFVAPYVDLHHRPPTTLYQTEQIGPHIYDKDGSLVWSGASLFHGRTIFDFRTAEINGSSHLTFIVGEDMHHSAESGGAGVILDSSFQPQGKIHMKTGRGTMNMHEFQVIDHGKTALMITYSSQLFDMSPIPGREMNAWLGNNGFQEVDVVTGKTLFEWWALDHVLPTESLVAHPNLPGSYSSPWDFFHMNSVDKNSDGDYLISARYTNCIYKISGKDGSVMWKLGGSHSTIKLQGFNFSSQHDARFREENSTTTIISFLDNAANDWTVTANYSSGMLVAIDHTTNTASIITQWNRPDKGLSRLRGNVQMLPNNNAFVGWSENAYISEFNIDGNCILEAQFASHRFATYRAYKFNFTSTPAEPPDLKAEVYGLTPETSTTVYHVSWNGATEVAAWKFWASADETGKFELAGQLDKSGFETIHMSAGFAARAYAEAVAADGRILGKSAVQRPVVPEVWKANELIPSLNDAADANNGGSGSAANAEDSSSSQGSATSDPHKGSNQPLENQLAGSSATDSSAGENQPAKQNATPFDAAEIYSKYSTIGIISGFALVLLILLYLVTRRLRIVPWFARAQRSNFAYQEVSQA